MPKDSSSAKTGNDQTVATAPLTTHATNAQAAENRIMGHKNALKQKRLNAGSTYRPAAWKRLLESSRLIAQYPN